MLWPSGRDHAGLEAKISKLLAEAQQVRRRIRSEAKLISRPGRTSARKNSHVALSRRQEGRAAQLEFLRAKLLDVLFQDGMPIHQMAKSLGQDAAYLRSATQVERVPSGRGSPSARSVAIASPKR